MSGQQNGLKADKGRSYREIERIAGQWRGRLGYEPHEQLDALRLFDIQLGDLKLFSTKVGEVEVWERVMPCSDEGFTRWDIEENRLEMVLSETSYSDLQSGLVRPRFTTCHEFGHAVMHTDELIRLAGMTINKQAAMYRKREHGLPFDSEWQANAFAAAMLIPAAGAKWLADKYGYLTEDLIAEHFATSVLAARYRLESMEKL